MSSTDDMLGRMIAGRYEIVERIGSGGMGVVWKAKDKVLDRYVALKILRPEMSEDEGFVQRFRQEAKAAASLSHNNIVSIYDVGEDRGLHFIVMELVEGRTLRDILNETGSLSVDEALSVAAQICSGLAHAHASGIIHRDVKPQNILITRTGQVKVADFGIARALGAASNTGKSVVVGSASYLSPEQVKDGVVSAASDLYSLGIVLYEMLTGQVPYTGDTAVAVALQHVEGRIPSIREKRPDVPIELEMLITKALAKDPKDRFQSAQEMLAAMRRVSSRAISDPHAELMPEGDQKMSRQKKRSSNRALKLFGVVVLVGLALGGYAIYAFNNWMSVPVVEVPDIVGKNQVEAQELLVERGLVPRLSAEKYDPDVPANTVISQSPLGGEKVKQGREVYYVLSKGESLVNVPDVRELTLREAQLELENNDLELGNVDHVFHDTVPEDHVITQNPRANTSVSIGTRVDLSVSKGPQEEKTIVPRLIGLILDKAESTLKENSLELGEVSKVHTNLTAGTVITQDPTEGTEVLAQSKVNVTISIGPEEPVRSYTIQIKVPEKDGPVHVKVVVMDMRGEAVCYEEDETPDQTISVTFEYKGSAALVKVYFDDKFSYEEVIKP